MNRELMYGTLYLLGPLSRNNTPAHTSINANNVPMLVRSVTHTRFKNKEGTATMIPVNIVEKAGVLNLGCIFENRGGNRPSLLILIHILGCPIWKTSKTLAIAIIALNDIIPEIQSSLQVLKTKARGSPTFKYL